MARRVERGHGASARTLPSDHRQHISQPPRPGTPFSVPQGNIHTLPQGGKHLQGFQPPRPGTPFSVPQWGKHLTSIDPKDFVPPGLIRPTRHKFRCPKPYEDQRFKKPDAKVTEKLQELKDLIKASANKSTLDHLRDLKENKKLTVPLPLRVPEGMSNPLTRDTRPSVLQPATKKRVASFSVPIPGKVKKSRAVSTGFEEPMDFDQLGGRVPATSTKHSTEDASSNFKEDHTVAGPSSADPSAAPGPSSADSSAVPGTSCADSSAVPGTSSADPSAVPGTSSADPSAVPGTSSADSSALPGTSCADPSAVSGPSSADTSALPGTSCADSSDLPGPSSADTSALPGTSCADSSAVPGPSSADSSAGQHGQVISPHIQGSLYPSLSSQGDLGSSTSPRDAQGLSVSHQEVLELTKCFQGSMGHSTSAPASQSLPTYTERKIIHVFSSRRRFKSSPPTLQVTNLSNSPPKHVGEDPSGQGDLQQAPSEKDSSKPSSLKSKISDFLVFTNGLSPTTSSQEILTSLTAGKAGQSDMSSHKDSQRCSPSSPKCPKPSASTKMCLRPDPADQGNCRTSPLNQEDFQSLPPLKNGLRSSLTVQRGLNAIMGSHVSLTTLTPAQAETKFSTFPPEAQGYLPFSGRVLESSTHTQDVVETPESTQGIPVPSEYNQSHLAPSPSSPGVLRPPQSVRGALALSPSTEDGQRHVLKSALPQKRRIKYSSSLKCDPEKSHSRKRALKDAPSKQTVFKISISDRELFIYPLPSKRALLTCHQDQKSQGCTKTLPVSHASSILVQCAETIQPSLPPQGKLDNSVSVGVALKFSPKTSEMLGFAKPVHSSPSTTLTQKETVVQNTSTTGVLATDPSLEMALGCGTSKGALEAVLPIKLAMKPDVSIQNVLSSSPAEQSSLSTSTNTQGGGLETSLPDHEALRTNTCVHGALGETTSTQVTQVPFPHAEATVKTCTGIQGTLRPSPSQQEALEYTISEQGALQLCTPTQECSFYMPSLGRNSKCSVSTKVVTRHSVSRKNRLRIDPSDKGAFKRFRSDEDSFNSLPPAKRGLVSSSAAKETSKGTTTSKVSPTPSISVPKALECSTNDQGTGESCQSTQKHAGHSISSQKSLVCSPSAPGIQGISSSLPRAPEHVSHAQSNLSLCKIDFSTTQPFLYFQGSKGKSTSKKNCLECVPLAQKCLNTSMSSKASKNPSGQGNLEPLVSDQGKGTKYQSENDDLGQAISAHGTGGHSRCKKGALGSTRHAHRKAEIVPSNQGAEKPSLSLTGAMRLPKSETKTLEKLPSKQGSISSTKGTKKPLLSSQGNVTPSTSAPHAQKPPQKTSGTLKSMRCKQGSLEHSMCVQETVDPLPSTPGFAEHSTSFQKKLGHSSHMVESQDTSPSFQGTTCPLPPRGDMGLPKSEPRTLEKSPSKQGSSPTKGTKKP